MQIRVPRVEWTGEWEAAFGQPQRTGVWYLWGNSGHGKTTFVLMLMKELSEHGRVLYCSYEEGEASLSLQTQMRRIGMGTAARIGLTTMPMAEVSDYLDQPRSADFVVIDSLEYSGIGDGSELLALSSKHRQKLFVMIGQAEYSTPSTRVGREALYLANQKIWIEGFRAFSRGRSFGERRWMNIWDVEAQKYWSMKGR
jgi:hypothetical protein